MTTTARRPLAHVVEDIEFILDAHPRILVADLAARLGYSSRDGVQHALRRAGRQDLLDRLTRNSLSR